MRRDASLMLVASLLVFSAGVQAKPTAVSRGCLYSTKVGSEAVAVVRCADADPLNVANDPNVRKVAEALGIAPTKVRFQGCKGLRFSAVPVASGAGTAQYVITYPTEEKDSYLAPIAHELAHVVQMEMAGGLESLRETSSKRIELGADYLTGVVFGTSLKHIDPNHFQHNLSLLGVYVELEQDAHGTWPQRTAAFRFGMRQPREDLRRDIRKASQDFQANRYGHVIEL